LVPSTAIPTHMCTPLTLGRPAIGGKEHP
jgi:hypothetical protein